MNGRLLLCLSPNQNPVNRNFRKLSRGKLLLFVQTGIAITTMIAIPGKITMAYQVRNLDHFPKFRLTGFQLSEFDCIVCL